jgi:CMP-N-acetylneuraminic acid synthetase
MKLKDEFWAFIPARSGSKKIKNKNIKKLNNIPLLAYSIIAAKKNSYIKKTIFSSDNSNYAKIGKKYGKFWFHKRKKNISLDNSNDLEMFKDFIKYYISKNYHLPKYFVHLRPTTPIRSNETIHKAIKYFKKNSKKYSSLRSVSEMSETAYKSYRIINKKLCAITKRDFNLDKYNMPRDNYEKTYEANGIIDIYKTKNIIKNTLLGKKVLPYEVKDFNSEIDSLDDFLIVEKFVKLKKIKI